MKALAAAVAAVVVCAAHAAGPSEAVGERVLANHTPSAVASVYRAFEKLQDDLETQRTDSEECDALLDEWEDRFAGSLLAMDAYLRGSLDGWVERSGPSDVRSEADATIEAARRALDGIAPAPGVNYLAAFDPRFDADPLAEMNEGVTHTHTTDGSGASDGLLFSIEAPLSWIHGHARGGGMAKRLVSEAGAGLASLSVVVVPIAGDEATPSLDEIAAGISDDPVGVSETTLLGQEARVVTFRGESSSRYGASRAFEKHVVCVLDGRVVKFEFSVADRSRSADDLLPMSELDAELKRLEPLFDEMVRRASATPER